MANIVKTYTMVNGQPADATQVNKNFDDIIAGVGDLTTLRPTVASLGLDADITSLSLPVNTTISAAGAELVNDADAAAQIATLGAVATGDSRLSDARVASDVYAWAKAASKPAYTPAEVGTKATTTGSVTTNASTDTVITHGLGTTPSYVGITNTSAGGTISFVISARTSTTFTISPNGAALAILWIAVA